MLKLCKREIIDIFWSTFRVNIFPDTLKINYNTKDIIGVTVEFIIPFSGVPTKNFQEQIKKCKKWILDRKETAVVHPI